jgi:hypothetical protein
MDLFPLVVLFGAPEYEMFVSAWQTYVIP